MKDSQILEFISKVENLKKTKNIDLSSAEDLSIGIMNLVSIEEHLAFSLMKTDDLKYLNLLNSVREIRKSLLQKIVKKPKGEEWCISKHLLAATMRIMETANKYLKEGNKKDAYELFKDAFDVYSLFWIVNLDIKTDSKVDSDEGVIDTKFIEGKNKWKVSEIFKKILNCCKE